MRSLPREPRGLRGVQELLLRALLRLSRLLLRALQLLLRPPLLERSQHRHLLRRAWRWGAPRLVAGPFCHVFKVLSLLDDPRALLLALVSCLALYLGGLFLLLAPVEANLRMAAAACYLLFASIVAYCRYATRAALGVEVGDPVTDCCVAVLAYPLVLLQCEREVDLGPVAAELREVDVGPKDALFVSEEQHDHAA